MELHAPRRLELDISPALAGRTVDTLLRNVLKLSGTTVKRAKAAPGGILLDGRPVFVHVSCRAGQRLSVVVGDMTGGGAVLPAPGPLDIVFEDADLLILNKAPGVAVHPGPGHHSDTLGNFTKTLGKPSASGRCTGWTVEPPACCASPSMPMRRKC